jgi:hypothetical protein
MASTPKNDSPQRARRARRKKTNNKEAKNTGRIFVNCFVPAFLVSLLVFVLLCALRALCGEMLL